MKHSIFRRRADSFTLVELLVVIAIIAILASVLIRVAVVGINAAKRAKANTTANSMQTAVLGYYTEYSVYPLPTGTTAPPDYLIGDTATSVTPWKNMIEALCGNISPSSPATAVTPNVPNARAIAFLTLKGNDVDANDAPLNPLPTGAEIYFNMAIDADYSGIIGDTTSAVTLPKFSGATYSANGGVITSGVAVWANCNSTSGTTNVAWFVHTY